MEHWSPIWAKTVIKHLQRKVDQPRAVDDPVLTGKYGRLTFYIKQYNFNILYNAIQL
jgi:hypothetical protein